MYQPSSMSLTSVNTGGEDQYRIVLLETEVARLQFQNVLQEQELEQYKVQQNRLIDEIVALKTRYINSERHSNSSSSIVYNRLASPIDIVPGEHNEQPSIITEEHDEQHNGVIGVKEILAQANKCCLNPFCMFEGLYHDGACKAEEVKEVFDWKTATFMKSPSLKGALYAPKPSSTSPKMAKTKKSTHAHKPRTAHPPVMAPLPVKEEKVKEEVKTQIKDKKAPTYNGIARWSEYLTQFNLIARLNKWDDDTKALQLATSLTDDARCVLMDVKELTWQELVKKLEAKYEPKDPKAVYHAMLRCRTRKASESLPDLMSDIKRMIRRAYPTADEAMKEELCVKHFKESMQAWNGQCMISWTRLPVTVP